MCRTCQSGIICARANACLPGTRIWSAVQVGWFVTEGSEEVVLQSATVSFAYRRRTQTLAEEL